MSAYAAVSERADALAGRDFSWGSICVELWRCQKYHSLLCRILRTWKSRSTKKNVNLCSSGRLRTDSTYSSMSSSTDTSSVRWKPHFFLNLSNSRHQIPQQSNLLADTWIEKVRLGISFVFVTSRVAVSTTTGISKKQNNNESAHSHAKHKNTLIEKCLTWQ